ncbi:hypothetical protein ABEB36_001411 [Hypothenemus hampei]|uniref:Uncharacterized protein n=1 Tax=Hypothenemus hampei TaxID=57062 RepID=A0ABD1FHP8_HYPHA
MRKSIKYFLIILVVLCLTIEEGECRRKIVRGRKRINRHYMKPLPVPAFVIVILVAIGQLILGAIMYLIMKVAMLDKPFEPRYSHAPISSAEDRPLHIVTNK